VGVFSTTHDQAVGARQLATLANPRSNHASLVIGGYLYVLGGVSSSGSLNSVERALINADGSLGRFVAVPGVTLATPRQGHTAVRIRDRLYVIGGFGNGSLASVEYATVAEDGSLGPFTMISDVGLMTARRNHTSAVIGNYLYVIGGVAANPLSSIERAVIHGDGSLGQFAPVTGASLVTARQGHASAVIGDTVYVVGGAGNSGPLQDVERASINADGSLGPFMAASGATLVTARADCATAVIGNSFYVFGGVGSRGSLTTIERAPVKGGESLGAFEAVSSLVGERHGHSITTVGNYLYILGGSDDIGFIGHSERATLNASGLLGTFDVVPGVALATECSGSPGVVLGNYFYIFGCNNDPNGVQRASINADGSMGPFSHVLNTLVEPTDGYTTAVIGPYLYILGGTGKSIERSTINVDGTIGPFELVSTSTLTTSRLRPAAAIIGNYVYVFGGDIGTGETAGIDRALINPDSSLGTFAHFIDSAATAHVGLTTPIVGYDIYVIYGLDSNAQPQRTVQRAQLDVNGSLGTFDVATDVTVDVQNTIGARLGPDTMMIGDYLYALGNLPDVERAKTITTGVPALGAFAAVSDITVIPSRSGEAISVIGNYAYLVGGASGRVILNSVSRAVLK
jgi:N-acetylneuraminic acid mutarotase